MKRAIVESVESFNKKAKANVPKLVEFGSGDAIPEGVRFASFRSKEDDSLVLTAETDRLSYVNQEQPQQLMLAVVSKSTGRARLVPLQLFSLRPVLEEEAEEEGSSSLPAARPTAVDVGRTFGMARWQRLYSKSQKLRVAGGAGAVAVSRAVDSALMEDSTVPPPERLQPAAVLDDQEQGLLIPPRHTDASRPEEVYRRQEMIPEPVWRDLQKNKDYFVKQLARSDNEYLKKYCALYEERDPDRFTLLTYAHYLLRLLKYMRHRFPKKTWRPLRTPGRILDHLCDLFLEPTHEGWVKSDRLIDKAICYLLVVMLWVHGLTLDLEEAANVTGVTMKKLNTYLSTLGLTVAGRSATLKLPLKLRPPQVSRRLNKVVRM